MKIWRNYGLSPIAYCPLSLIQHEPDTGFARFHGGRGEWQLFGRCTQSAAVAIDGKQANSPD